MKIEYFHASKYGNGVMVAEEFKKQMAGKGVTVNVHHIRDARPKELPPADLYLFSSPGRCGKPIWGMRRFLKKAQLPAGTKYAILTTEMPTPEERTKWQRIIPVMNERLQDKGSGQGRRGQDPGDRPQGPAGGGLAEESGSLRRPDPHPALTDAPRTESRT